ncbi:MAG: ROK family transcriptional regulator [Oscillospiraceae bacterium]|jgi:predicted NBD/HSP70 family sugar kinase|nr:ROK family transcriptional regulator [Oscillospiraceae bacterium]
MKVNAEIKQLNRIKILQHILTHRSVSRQEIAADLGFSMPTVLQNVTELIEAGFVCESGKYGSTGGRKATVLSIREGRYCVAGVEVTKQHLCLVLSDLSRRLLAMAQHELPFRNTREYYGQLGELIRGFITENRPAGDCTLMGVGFSLPGILDLSQGLLVRSHTLEVSNVSLLRFSQNVPCDTWFDNDANAAAYAEVEDAQQNTIYLSLNDTVGGAMYLNGSIYRGDNGKGAEFGHMILVPRGRRCYCGKKGCLDAYCSAKVLRQSAPLEQFFTGLQEGAPENTRQWEAYLDCLALAVSNLRMAYDCTIILGGDVGGNMSGLTDIFEEKLREYNNFDYDTSYIQLGKYRSGSAAIGAARLMGTQYIVNLRF